MEGKMDVRVELAPEGSVCEECSNEEHTPWWHHVVGAGAAIILLVLILIGSAVGMRKGLQYSAKWLNANDKADMLHSMNSDSNDVAANFVVDSYRAVCAKDYVSQACATAVANNVKVSALNAEQKARAKQLVAQYSEVSIQLLP